MERAVLRLTALLVALALAVPAGAGESLAGRLLVATLRMPPNLFSETVVLMLAHGPEGALGVIVNRPAEGAALAHAAAALAREAADPHALDGVPRHLGGPVLPAVALLLTEAAAAPSPLFTAGGYALSALAPMLDPPPPFGRALLVIGHAGWGPGQLEAEIAQGGWTDVAADADLVFGRDNAAKWRRALTRRLRDL